MPRLLLIDDEQSVRYSFRRVFEPDGIEVSSAASAAEGLALADAMTPDVVVLDLQLPDAHGLDVFRSLKEKNPRLPVVFITAHGTTDTAIQAMKEGAFDYLVKPVDLERLSQLLHRAFEAARLMNVPALLPTEREGDRIIGTSPIMQETCKAIGRLAPQDVNVLILGESGSGKELVARALYQHSHRADKPFLAINCPAVPEALFESELFGHEQGAFTGASRRRIGKFEQADGGTLFLDEIGDLSPSVQAKLLRVLQEQQFERLGSNEIVRTRVRILAATNCDLAAQVEAGKFRKDLYYRLNVVTIRVPSLRERLEDIPELAHYFLFRFNAELNLNLRGFAPEALELFQSYSWPGNVRELMSVIKHAMLNATGTILLPEFIALPNSTPPSLIQPSSELDLNQTIDRALDESPGQVYSVVIEAVERVLLGRVLKRTQGHQAKASEILGLNRTTLRTRLRSLGLSVDRVLVDEKEIE